VPADRANGGRLAVHEVLAGRVGEHERAHRIEQRGRAGGDPLQAQVARCVERELVLGVLDLDHDEHGHPCRDAGERCGDRRQDARVADHQVPRRRRVGRVRAAGTEQLEPVTRLRAGGPRAGQPGVAVDDEVDREPSPVRVPVAHGERAHARPLGAGQLGLDRRGVERRRVGRTRRREHELHVVVGERAHAEALEVLAAEDQPHHPWRQPGRLQHGGELGLAVGHVRSP
jgi:hypothetical protein